jgi:hypothetical protein
MIHLLLAYIVQNMPFGKSAGGVGVANEVSDGGEKRVGGAGVESIANDGGEKKPGWR